MALAAVSALQDSALAGLDALPSGIEAAQAAVEVLSSVACSPTVNGWLGGVAALGWARLAAALLQRGLLLSASDAGAADAAAATAEGAGRLVEVLVAPTGGGALPGTAAAGQGDGAATSGHRGAASSALRCGAATGLAVLLGADVEGGAFGNGLGAGEREREREACYLLLWRGR